MNVRKPVILNHNFKYISINTNQNCIFIFDNVRGFIVSGRPRNHMPNLVFVHICIFLRKVVIVLIRFSNGL